MQYKNIVVLTGAGISAESGIRTFRDQNGLWENHAIEEVATAEGFQNNPALVHQFYNARRAQLLDAQVKPNAAHLALSTLEKHILAQGGHFLLVTQNVDNLHQRAGSQSILAMHGQLQQVKCVHSGLSVPWLEHLTTEHRCSCCHLAQSLRPDIVWFGETPYHLDVIENALLKADLFVAIGTSGNVYPAAGFTDLAARAGAMTLEINLEPTRGQFASGVYGKASQVVPKWVNELIDG